MGIATLRCITYGIIMAYRTVQALVIMANAKAYRECSKGYYARMSTAVCADMAGGANDSASLVRG
jgi:hypothetical protein